MCLILSEILDIDCIPFVPPDTRIKLGGDKFTLKPLKFIKRSHRTVAGARKLFVRLKFSHFILYTSSQAKNKILPGKAANEDHHLDGTHDLATGTCDPRKWQQVQTCAEVDIASETECKVDAVNDEHMRMHVRNMRYSAIAVN